MREIDRHKGSYKREKERWRDTEEKKRGPKERGRLGIMGENKKNQNIRNSSQNRGKRETDRDNTRTKRERTGRKDKSNVMKRRTEQKKLEN